MSESHSGALVLFGATGDLAHKKIFPSPGGWQNPTVTV
jgi:glucose-6-phosphate 1-dehydrogenase